MGIENQVEGEKRKEEKKKRENDDEDRGKVGQRGRRERTWSEVVQIKGNDELGGGQ